MSSVAQSSQSSRSRANPRKRIHDDASYIGNSGSASTGEPRLKRKRVEPIAVPLEADTRITYVCLECYYCCVKKSTDEKAQVDFNSLPLSFIHKYLTLYDLIPPIRPLPMTAEDPPIPLSLLDPRAHSRQPSPPAPQVTPANRPKRDLTKEPERRRSSRLLDDPMPTRAPILADVAELNKVLAEICHRHFHENISISGREEVDTLAAFMCTVENNKARRERSIR
ncbi:hypothetical protein Moror_366 [Moniliophthora roreri MCA 2997]|uniref:Histone deacetylase complex subunit SAP30 Sin3 binding domain-containing protein n=1 Tax=Moniliophthora roreri (strain MCA 2997) TaxID=1381753 RepID=V2Y051_MONRO|nr:hypothetical protein Moror_366 [Moniliophthora roreri MCA 2997]